MRIENLKERDCVCALMRVILSASSLGASYEILSFWIHVKWYCGERKP